MPIEKDESGKAEIHHTKIFNSLKFWREHGCFDKIFEASVVRLFNAKMLDTDILHGDGACTTAKKGAII